MLERVEGGFIKNPEELSTKWQWCLFESNRKVMIPVPILVRRTNDGVVHFMCDYPRWHHSGRGIDRETAKRLIKSASIVTIEELHEAIGCDYWGM